MCPILLKLKILLTNARFNLSGCNYKKRHDKIQVIEMKRVSVLLLLVVLAASSVLAQNKVLSLDGDGGYVEIPEGIWFSGDLTIEAWVLVREHTFWSRIIDFGNGAGKDVVLFALSQEASGLPVFEVYNGQNYSGGKVISSKPLEKNVWTHVACTLEGKKGTVYMDGVTVG